MTLKRKLDADSDDVSPVSTKQLKLVPFPNIELDTDVAMSEAESLYPNIHHSRLPSGASSISSSASDSPVSGILVYPSFDLYPLPPFRNDSLDSNSDNSALSPNCPVGLLQPSSPFIHHGGFYPLLLANSGQTVHKSRNLGSPAPLASTVTARCGAIAKAAAQFLW